MKAQTRWSYVAEAMPALVVVGLLATSARTLCRPVSALEPPARSEDLSDDQQRELLAERDRLWERASELLQAGKPRDAIEAAESMLTIERRLFGDQDAEVAFTLGWLSERYVQVEEFRAAQGARQEQVDILVALHGSGDWRVADARWELKHTRLLTRMSEADWRLLRRAGELHEQGRAAYGRGDHAHAEALARQVLAIRQRLFDEPHPAVVTSLLNLGAMLELRTDYANAKDCYKQALAMQRELYPVDECTAGHPKLAATLVALGHLLELQRDYLAAREHYQQALTMRRRLYPVTEHPKGHPDIAGNLQILGQLVYSQYDRSMAREYFEEALTMRRCLYPQGHREVAASLNDLGMLHQSLIDYVAARRYYEEALAVVGEPEVAEVSGHAHRDMAAALHNLASLLEDQGDYASARAYLNQVLAINRQLYSAVEYPQGHPDLAITLRSMGSLLRKQEDYVAAREFYEQALAMNERIYPSGAYPHGHTSLASCFHDLGQILMLQGDYVSARDYLQKSLEMRRQLYPVEQYPQGDPSIALSLQSLGSLLVYEGDYVTALDFYEQTLDMDVRVYPVEEYPQGHPSLAEGLNSLGGLLDILGDESSAEEYYKKALDMRRKLYPSEQYPRGHPEIAMSLHNMGTVSQEDAVAQDYFEQALAMMRRLYPAEQYPNGHSSVVAAFNALGSLLSNRGDYAAARNYYEQALAMNRRLYPAGQYASGHPELARTLQMLGRVLESEGDRIAARKYFEDALDVRRKLYPPREFPDGHPDLASTLTDLGALLAALDDVLGAVDLWRQAYNMHNAELQRFVNRSSLELISHVFLSQEDVDDLLITLAIDHVQAREPAYRCLLARKVAVLDSLIRRRKLLRLASTDSEIAQLETRLRAVRQQLANIALQPTNPGRQKRREELVNAANAVESSLRRAVDMELGNTSHVVPRLGALAQRLGRDNALIDLVRFYPADFKATGDQPRWLPPRYVAFVVRGGETAADLSLVDLGEAAPIETQIGELRELVGETQRQLRFASEEGIEAQYMDAAAALSATVFAPLQPHLEGVDSVYLAPDGELTRIPFEALVDREGNYLIERYAFTYLSSGSDLLREPSDPADGTIVFAAPDYDLNDIPTVPSETLLAELTRSSSDARQGDLSDDTRGLSWTPLPATETEAARVVELLAMHGVYGPAHAFLGADALEGLLKRMQAPRILHLATHGFYLEEQERPLPDDGFGRGIEIVSNATHPAGTSHSSAATMARLGNYENPLLRSGLVLAGANRRQHGGTTGNDEAERPDDGWVTAEEIGLLDLKGTELVVLSACETGLGDIRTGEGVSGLRRAFIYAGAETLITSLYKVPDEATQQLMTEFYTRLTGGATKLEALRDAQLEIIKQRREQHSAAHPFFWASFVLVGDPN